MSRILQNIRTATTEFPAEWRKWWAKCSWLQRLLPISLVIVYWGILFSIGGLRPDNIYGVVLLLALYYAGPRLYPIFQLLFPLLLTGMIYDSQRYYADYLRGPVHVKEPYLFDKHFFGITLEDGTRLTPNEWWQLHTSAALDFITGVAYIVFVPVFVLTVAYFRFWVSRNGTKRYTGWGIHILSPQMMWAFFWVNMLGYSTYYWYAASPPWYVALYGIANPANLQEPANLAGCARFDQLIGAPFFREWYGRSADVHGAIPSLHIAYPLQAAYYAYKFGAGRVFTTAFWLLMVFSAVYLNHHYILDIMWGSVYALLVCYVVDLVWSGKLKRAASGVWKPSPVVGQKSSRANSAPKGAPTRPSRKPE